MRLSMNMLAAVPEAEQEHLQELIEVFNDHESKNRLKRRYYEGHVTLGEVNLGLALPNSIMKLEIGCAWGAKCVDVLAARSMFDGFVGVQGETVAELESPMIPKEMYIRIVNGEQ